MPPLRCDARRPRRATSASVGARRGRAGERSRIRQVHHVSRYAHAMGCSEKTLTRICGAMVGVGAKSFSASRLALEAKRLLVHTEMPISAIAQRLGFDEATNFTKFFRSIEGCTPGDFRRRLDVSL